MEPIDAILEQDIPEAQQSLRDSHVNLEKVAQYCKANYVQAENKKVAFEETKNYAIQALASVAYQINVFSYNLSQLFEAQDAMVEDMEAEVNHVDQTIKVHKEKIARRDIGALATTNKPNQRQSRVLSPPVQERAIRYSRRPIDYSIYDDIGHGLKINSHVNQPRNVRKSDTGSASSNSQNPTYDTNAIYRKTGNMTGTLSRKQTGNMGDYRTPQIAPVQPPVAPAVISSNGHYGPGLNQKQPYNSPHMNQRSEHYHPGSLSNYSTGSASPPVYPIQQSQQYSPIPSAAMQYPNQRQQQQPAFHYPVPSSQISRKSSSASTSNYGTLPVNSINLNGNHSNHQPPHVIHAMSNNGNGAHPPSAGQPDIYGRTGNGKIPESSATLRYIQNPVSVNVSQPPPPPPPPPTGSNGIKTNRSSNGFVKEPPSNGAIPSVYLEKVVAIYDYQADKEDELSFMENQIIYVIKKNDDGWYEGVMNGLRGLFPGNYVEPSA